MPLDTSVFDKIKTFSDYQKADQDFQLRKALAAQQLQSGGIDAQTKANIYATQVLSAATATGDQDAYDTAKRTLQGQGVDVSTWAPDVGSGAQQAQAARLAQSPLGSLLNAGLKGEANNIAATQAMGSVTGGAQLDPLSTSLMGKLGLNAISGAPPQVGTIPERSPLPPIVQPRIAPQVQAGTPAGNQAINDLYGDSQPAQPVTLTPQAPPPQTAAPAPSIPRFNPPPQQSGETNQAYQQRVQTAFEAYKADPGYQIPLEAAKTTATKQAELRVTKTDAANVSQQTYNQLLQNINALKQISPNIPDQGVILSPEAQAAMSMRIKALGIPGMGNADASNSIQSYNTISEQQVLNTIKQLVASGQIRGNKFLEKIATQASIAPIDGTTTDAGRQQILDQIAAELQNSSLNAQNQAAAMNGQPSQPYKPLPQAAAAAPKPGATMQGTDGTYLFNGGDPSQQSSWKKVK